MSAQPGIPPKRHRGRPPSGLHMGGWLLLERRIGVPHRAAVDRELFVQRRRKYDRARYWAPAKKVRKSRRARSARKSGRPRIYSALLSR